MIIIIIIIIIIVGLRAQSVYWALGFYLRMLNGPRKDKWLLGVTI